MEAAGLRETLAYIYETTNRWHWFALSHAACYPFAILLTVFTASYGYLHLKMDLLGPAEKLVPVYQATRRHIPEDRSLYCSRVSASIEDDSS
jgi:hypothetical protein